MSEKLYQYSLDKRGVAIISLNRPEVHNAFNDQLILQLIECFNAIEDDKGVRVIVLRGNGKSFCAGADINWMKKMIDYSQKQNYEDSLNLANFFKTINNLSRPIIACVHGVALGGGSGLVCVCDHVIASDDTRFGFTEVKLGLAPAVISPYVIARVGEAHARGWFLSGALFSAHIAFHMGLVNRVVPKDRLEEELEKTIEDYLKAAPNACSEIKKLISRVCRKKSAPDTVDIVEDTCRTISKLRVSKEGQEGMSALLEKRTANWHIK